MRSALPTACLLLIACSGGEVVPATDGGPPRDDAALDAAPADSSLPPTTDGGGPDGSRPDVPARAGFGVGACAQLAAVPPGAIVVSPSDDLASIIAGASSGAVIALQDGTYAVPSGGLVFSTPGITLRSVSGAPAAVVLDGGWSTAETVRIYADDITLAELTITRAVDHLAHVSPTGTDHVDRASFYRVRFIDGGEQFLKVNSGGGTFEWWTNDGKVECSDFVMTAEGRAHTTACYTGGIDVHGGQDWVVRNSYFEGIWCDDGLAEHAIHFWARSRDTLIENNLMIDNARGVGLGLGSDPSTASRRYPDGDPSWDVLQHVGGLVRNNVIWDVVSRHDTGIELQRVAGAKVIHNTVLSRESSATARFSSIDYRFPSTTVVIRNNLVWRITVRDGASGTVEGNVEGADESWLQDVDGRDFHLAASAADAIDDAIPDSEAGVDIDGTPRPAAAPDVGADER